MATASATIIKRVTSEKGLMDNAACRVHPNNNETGADSRVTRFNIEAEDVA